MKKYLRIETFKDRFIEAFKPGDLISITEKLDGANFSIDFDKDGKIHMFSRNNELDAIGNNLRGAYQFVLNNVDLPNAIRYLGDRYILFMEWLVPHTVHYPKEAYNKVYAFDVYDKWEDHYCTHDFAKQIAEAIGIPFVHTFYFGEFISWEHCNSFVGKTVMGGEYGEGVVVKNQTTMTDPENRLPFYIKLKSEKFTETKAHNHEKYIDPEVLKEKERLSQITSTIITEARVQHVLDKLIDEGIVPCDWNEKDMGTIAKNLPKAVYEDCVLEEPDIVKMIGKDIGKFAMKQTMDIIRKMLPTR